MSGVGLLAAVQEAAKGMARPRLSGLTAEPCREA